jgi:UDP-3-O-[3-hydroxymyristoyl] glucosamine N-acyltransferase
MITLKQIAARVGGELFGNEKMEIKSIAGIKEAKEGDITFLADRKFESLLATSKASAVIFNENTDSALHKDKSGIRVNNVRLAVAQASALFEEPIEVQEGTSALAHVSSEATISREASIFPFVFIDKGAVINRNVVIFPFCFIGKDVEIGEGTIIYPNVCIYGKTIVGKRVIIHAGTVVGSDGFGYELDGLTRVKKHHTGKVVIKDDVEIGANTCIDRAFHDSTVIKNGTKIDNLVQVAHNVTIGENCVLAAQVGIAGSAKVGDNVTFGGKVGVTDHAEVGNGVFAAGGTGITRHVNAKAIIAGVPHMEYKQWRNLQRYLRKLPKLFRRVDKIEAQDKDGI